MTGNRIFISYRRTDSGPESGWLRDSLSTVFGEDEVFQDVLMTPGTTFDFELLAELDRAAVVLVVIGDEWLGARDQFHRRRLDQPDDWVRREIIASLQGEAMVIPVLLDDTEIPPVEAFPTELQPLAFRVASRLRVDYWQQDFEALARLIAEETGWVATGADPGPIDKTWLFGSPPHISDSSDYHDQLPQVGAPSGVGITTIVGSDQARASQLAALYCQQYEQHFDYRCWIDMEAQGGRADLRHIADELDLHELGVDAVDSARNHITTSPERWLIVFDGAEAPKDVLGLLPQSQTTKTLVTSRHRKGWNQFGRVVAVSKYSWLRTRPLKVAAALLAAVALLLVGLWAMSGSERMIVGPKQGVVGDEAVFILLGGDGLLGWEVDGNPIGQGILVHVPTQAAVVEIVAKTTNGDVAMEYVVQERDVTAIDGAGRMRVDGDNRISLQGLPVASDVVWTVASQTYDWTSADGDQPELSITPTKVGTITVQAAYQSRAGVDEVVVRTFTAVP